MFLDSEKTLNFGLHIYLNYGLYIDLIYTRCLKLSIVAFVGFCVQISSVTLTIFRLIGE